MDDQPVTMPARHFTVQSLAAYWGVSPSHIYNLIHSNALRHLRIGKAIRIPSIFVKDFQEAACQLTTISTVCGNTITELGTLSGHHRTKKELTRVEQSAYQRGQEIAAKQNNSAPSSLQD